MNLSVSGETVSIPDLIVKLCNHISRNDQAVSNTLYKLAYSFLSSSCSMTSSTPSDEHYVVERIKQTLAPEHVEKFELLYSNICKSNILQHRCATLSLLYNLAKNPTQKEMPRWSLVQELDKFPTHPIRSKSQVTLFSGASQESIKNIFQASASKKYSSISARPQSSRVTTIPSTIWSRNELEGSSSKLSRGVSELNLITETDLLQDVIYSLQGIEGKFLRKEPTGLGFTIDPRAGKNLIPTQRGLVERLTGISFLHNQLKQYCEDNDKQSGIICQALIATLRDELTLYYKTVALLQASMKKQSCVDHSEMTLRRALYIIHEHQIRFEWLAYIAEQCNDKKGGALITAIHGFLQHGSKCAQEVSEKVLTAVCKPLYIMLSRWLLDGEINDPHNEFFIEARSICTAERLWHDKYNVRKSMVPSFITMEQAKKILATGKSINFLRQICKDGGQLPGRESLQKFFRTTSAEALFAPEQSLEFHSTLENVYRETSLRVLDLLKNKFRLSEHLQSLRRYLLLGQGDFIRHLLELLAPELNKPAQDIYCHTLTAILESAIRVTNAQYEDEDTLQRLNVSFMGYSNGDTGWDVFSLIYIVDGPVGTIFQPNMTTYQLLFGALWKAKRMEFILANMRKQQITISKLFKSIQELKPVMHIIHLLTSEMIHFLHQTQYYFLFEVLECSWAEMQRQVDRAECLDDIIHAHSVFLNSVKCGVLHDESSRQLICLLQAIYNFVVVFETHQQSLYSAASKEYEALCEYNRKAEKGDGFGLNKEEEAKAKKRIASFHQFLLCLKTQLNNSAQQYQELVKSFLKLLSGSSNMNLQLLSVRLSFNDYYQIT